jgi:hypothetical protein
MELYPLEGPLKGGPSVFWRLRASKSTCVFSSLPVLDHDSNFFFLTIHPVGVCQIFYFLRGDWGRLALFFQTRENGAASAAG